MDPAIKNDSLPISASEVLCTLTDGIVVLSRDWRFLFVNAAAEAILGLSAEELLGRDHWKLFPEVVGTNLEKLYREASESGHFPEMEHYSVRLRRWLHVKVHPSPAGLTVVLRDITALKTERAAQQLSEERFRLAASHRLITLFEQDAELRYTWLYPLHPEHNHAIGRTDEELGPGDTNRELAEIKRRVLKTGVELRREYKVFLADGAHHYDIFITPRRNAEGAVDGIAGTALDITDKKRAEEARAWLAAIVESSEDAIISKTIVGVIATWNKGAERMFGYTAAEIVGRSITVLIPPNRLDEETEILARLRRGERIDHYETIRQRKDGTQLEVSLSVSPIFDSQGKVMGASKIARNITERRRAE